MARLSAKAPQALAASCLILTAPYFLAGCSDVEPAPESSNPHVEYERYEDGKGQLQQSAHADLGNTTTEEILQVFHDMDAEVSPSSSNWMGLVIGTVGPTKYVLGVELEPETVSALLKAHDASAPVSPVGVSAYYDSVEINFDYCTSSAACVDEAAASLEGYATAFAQSDHLTSLSVFRPERQEELTIYKSGGPEDPDLYMDFLTTSMRLHQAGKEIANVDGLSVSPFYNFPPSTTHEYDHVGVTISVRSVSTSGSTCSEDEEKPVLQKFESLFESLDSRIPMELSVRCF